MMIEKFWPLAAAGLSVLVLGTSVALAGSGGEWECSTADGVYSFDGETIASRTSAETYKAKGVNEVPLLSVRSTCTNKDGQTFQTFEDLKVVAVTTRPEGWDQDMTFYVMCYLSADSYPNNNETDTTCVKDETQMLSVPGLKMRQGN